MSQPDTGHSPPGRAGAVIDPSDGLIFIATGNGDWNGTTDWGDALVELNSRATDVLGNYTPTNNDALNDSDLYEASSRKRIATLPCGSGHWNSPIVVDGKIILPEGDANRRASRGILDIRSMPMG